MTIKRRILTVKIRYYISVLPLFDQGSFAYINHATKRQEGITGGN